MLVAAGRPRVLQAAACTPPHASPTQASAALRRCTTHCSPSHSAAAQAARPQAGRPSRVVHVSSKIHFMGSIHRDDLNLERSYNSLAAYGQSKLAQVGMACSLAGWDCLAACCEAGCSLLPSWAGLQQPAIAACLACAVPPGMLPPPPAQSTAFSHHRGQVLFAWELQRRTGGKVVSVALHPGEVMTDGVRSLPGPLQRASRLHSQVALAQLGRRGQAIYIAHR